MLDADNTIPAQVVWNDAPSSPARRAAAARAAVQPALLPERDSPPQPAWRCPDVSMLADIAPGYAIFCSASGDCSTRQRIRGRRSAAPARRRRCWRGASRSWTRNCAMHEPPGPRPRQPAALPLGRRSLSAHGVHRRPLDGNDVGTVDPRQRPAARLLQRAPASTSRRVGAASTSTVSEAQAVALQPPRESMTLPAHQKPVANHQIDATVSCMAACRMGAVAEVKITGQKAFQAASEPVTLAAAGRQTVSIAFSSSQLTRLRRGLQRHRRIVAEVSAVIRDPQNRIRSATLAKRLTIKSAGYPAGRRRRR